MAKLTGGYYWTCALLLSDRAFLERWGSQIDPEDFPVGPLRHLASVALIYWQEHKSLLTEPALRSTLEAYLDPDDVAHLMRDYHVLMEEYTGDESAMPRLRELGEAWLERRWVGRAIDDASDALERGRTKKALATILDMKRVLPEEEPPLSTTSKDWDRRTRHVSREADAIPTKLGELDLFWDGGVHPGELCVLLAPTNVGKSMTLAYMAAQAFVADKRVLFYTFELTPAQIAQRFMGALFQQPIRKLPRHPFEIIREIKHNSSLDRAVFEVRDNIETLADLRAVIEQMDREGKKPDVVFLDSVDDLRPGRTRKSRYEELSEMYTRLRKDVARSLNVTIWTSTQATRDAVDKAVINLRQVSDCFDKARRSHLMVALTQTPDQLANENGDPIVGLYVLKDALHGTKGKKWEFYTRFGRGNMGYPAFKQRDADDWGHLD